MCSRVVFVLRGIWMSTFSHDALRILASRKQTLAAHRIINIDATTELRRALTELHESINNRIWYFVKWFSNPVSAMTVSRIRTWIYAKETSSCVRSAMMLGSLL